MRRENPLKQPASENKVTGQTASTVVGEQESDEQNIHWKEWGGGERKEGLRLVM